MLVHLAIRDVVLIERLDLDLAPGLCVLTGETGAGKSILLDALGLALGNRADAALLRSDAGQASVTAAFELTAGHPARAILEEQGLTSDDGLLVLRRVLGRDGRGRAFVNDQPASVALLRSLGDSLVEVQGQFEQRGLLDVATHRALLDAYGGLGASLEQVARCCHAWREAASARDAAAAELERARTDEAYLRHAVEELDALEPQPGEEAALAEQRALLMNAERLVETLDGAHRRLVGGEEGGGAESAIAAARRDLERVAGHAGERLRPVLDALERAAAETEDAVVRLQSLSADIDLDRGRQEEIEQRYFALKELARKHGVPVDDLARLREELAGRLAAVEGGAERVAELEAEVARAREAYLEAARSLSDGRGRAAEALDAAVDAELPPLRLDKASFRTRLEMLEEKDWGAHGMERVRFEAATNPGTPPGPLARIASGGELARFLLAIKVVLAQVSPLRSLVFDEVDSGIGGATAHAVGERLERLAEGRQILVVTHSPQVAARAGCHWRVAKLPRREGVVTDVAELDAAERREEIARMLSGAQVTDEARAAAEKLMGAA